MTESQSSSTIAAAMSASRIATVTADTVRIMRKVPLMCGVAGCPKPDMKDFVWQPPATIPSDLSTDPSLFQVTEQIMEVDKERISRKKTNHKYYYHTSKRADTTAATTTTGESSTATSTASVEGSAAKRHKALSISTASAAAAPDEFATAISTPTSSASVSSLSGGTMGSLTQMALVSRAATAVPLLDDFTLYRQLAQCCCVSFGGCSSPDLGFRFLFPALRQRQANAVFQFNTATEYLQHMNLMLQNAGLAVYQGHPNQPVPDPTTRRWPTYSEYGTSNTLTPAPVRVHAASDINTNSFHLLFRLSPQLSKRHINASLVKEYNKLWTIRPPSDYSGQQLWVFHSLNSGTPWHVDPADAETHMIRGQKLFVFVLLAEAEQNGILLPPVASSSAPGAGSSSSFDIVTTISFEQLLKCPSFCWLLLYQGQSVVFSHRFLHAAITLPDVTTYSTSQYVATADSLPLIVSDWQKDPRIASTYPADLEALRKMLG